MEAGETGFLFAFGALQEPAPGGTIFPGLLLSFETPVDSPAQGRTWPGFAWLSQPQSHLPGFLQSLLWAPALLPPPLPPPPLVLKPRGPQSTTCQGVCPLPRAMSSVPPKACEMYLLLAQHGFPPLPAVRLGPGHGFLLMTTEESVFPVPSKSTCPRGHVLLPTALRPWLDVPE